LIQVKSGGTAPATIDRMGQRTSAVEVGARGAPMKALRTIREEHRTLAAVLHGMLHIVREAGNRATEADFRVLEAMVYYIDTFPERFHHPKEDRYLFRLLRQRSPQAAALVDRLGSEHCAGAEKVRSLEQALARFHAGGESEFSDFRAAAEAYVRFHLDHMRAEERELLPLAEKHLTAADWNEIDAAFEGHSDPLLGVAAGERYDALFSRIVALAPPPIGVGPEH
jgi:hemerythrin-like domain-containing protein